MLNCDFFSRQLFHLALSGPAQEWWNQIILSASSHGKPLCYVLRYQLNSTRFPLRIITSCCKGNELFLIVFSMPNYYILCVCDLLKYNNPGEEAAINAWQNMYRHIFIYMCVCVKSVQTITCIKTTNRKTSVLQVLFIWLLNWKQRDHGNLLVPLIPQSSTKFLHFPKLALKLTV